MTNTVPIVTQIADHAAVQSDRWLMVAVAVASAAVIAWIIRATAGYFVRDRERLLTQMSEANTRALAQTEQLTRVVVANTEAMHGLTSKLDALQTFCSSRK